MGWVYMGSLTAIKGLIARLNQFTGLGHFVPFGPRRSLFIQQEFTVRFAQRFARIVVYL